MTGSTVKKRFSIRLLLHGITGFMALALIAVFLTSAVESLGRRQLAERVLNVVSISRDLFMAMQTIRVERGTGNTGLETAQPIDHETKNEITTLRARSNMALDAALAKIAASGVSESDQALTQIRAARSEFDRIRAAVDAALVRPKAQRTAGLSDQWIAGGAKLVNAIDLFSERLASDIDKADPLITEMMKIKQLAWVVRDAAGFDRLLVGAAIANGKELTPAQHEQFAMLSGRIEAAWQVITTDARILSLPPALKSSVALAQQRYFNELRAKRKSFLDQIDAGRPAPISGVEWVNLSNPPLETLINVANTAFDFSEEKAADDAAAASHALAGAVALGLLFLGCGIFATTFVSRQIARPMARVANAMRAVAQGDLDGEIPYVKRGDEIGELGRALAVFREKGIENRRLATELLRKERLSALGQLTATVAHELRNPLSAIRNTVFSFKEMAAGHGLDMTRPIERIERSVNRCDRIISELLDYTRLRELHCSDVLFDKWLDEVLNDQKLPEGVTLVRNLAAPGHAVHFDSERLRQVVINLVDNAAQALTAADNPSADRRIVVTTAARLESFEVVIADTGPGMAAEVLPKIFEPLFSTKSFGTGLGLPMVKQIVEQHGGTVAITSAQGKGTKVTLRLPHGSAVEIAA